MSLIEFFMVKNFFVWNYDTSKMQMIIAKLVRLMQVDP